MKQLFIFLLSVLALVSNLAAEGTELRVPVIWQRADA